MLQTLGIALASLIASSLTVTCAPMQHGIYEGSHIIPPHEQDWNEYILLDPTPPSHGSMSQISSQRASSESFPSQTVNAQYGGKDIEHVKRVYDRENLGGSFNSHGEENKKFDPEESARKFQRHAVDPAPRPWDDEYLRYEAALYAHRARVEEETAKKASQSEVKLVLDEESNMWIPEDWINKTKEEKVEAQYGKSQKERIVTIYRTLLSNAGLTLTIDKAKQNLRDAGTLGLVDQMLMGETVEQKTFAAERIHHEAGVYKINKDHFDRCRAKRAREERVAKMKREEEVEARRNYEKYLMLDDDDDEEMKY